MAASSNVSSNNSWVDSYLEALVSYCASPALCLPLLSLNLALLVPPLPFMAITALSVT